MKVFVNGASGTIGSRILKILVNRVNLTLGKYSGSVGQLPLFARKYPLYLADGADSTQRIEDAKQNGLNVQGTISDLNLEDFDLIIDATDGHATPGYVEMYRKSGKPFLIQGGYHSWQGPRFVSLPHLPLRIHRELQQLSCNETYLTTMVDLMLHQFFVEDITSIDVTLHRRFKDPEDKKEMNTEVSDMKENTHHKNGVVTMIPDLDGVVTTRANKNPWMHFHRPHTKIEFKQDISDEQIDALREEFKNYPRCVYVEDDLAEGKNDPQSMGKAIKTLLNIGNQLDIPDGDILLPVYTIKRRAPNAIEVMGFTPQRSITIPTTIDYLRMLERKDKAHFEIFSKTNSDFFWYGNNINQLKELLTQKISKEAKVKVQQP